MRKKISQSDWDRLVQLRAAGCSRNEIARELGVSFLRVKYMITRLPKEKVEKIPKKRIWFNPVRKEHLYVMPNPFRKRFIADPDFYKIKNDVPEKTNANKRVTNGASAVNKEDCVES